MKKKVNNLIYVVTNLFTFHDWHLQNYNWLISSRVTCKQKCTVFVDHTTLKNKTLLCYNF